MVTRRTPETRRRALPPVPLPLPDDAAKRLAVIPSQVWAPAYDSDGDLREGAWVAEATGVLDLSGWPRAPDPPGP